MSFSMLYFSSARVAHSTASVLGHVGILDYGFAVRVLIKGQLHQLCIDRRSFQVDCIGQRRIPIHHPQCDIHSKRVLWTTRPVE